MMAIDLGAEKVLGVEANPLMCEIAKEVLKVEIYDKQ
jgi:predicted RNA methylase